MKKLERVALNIQRYSISYVLILLLISAMGGASVLGLSVDGKEVWPGLKVNNSFEDWFREGDPGRKHYDILKEQFGGDDFIIVAFQTDDVFSQKSLQHIQQLTSQLEALPDVTGGCFTDQCQCISSCGGHA